MNRSRNQILEQLNAFLPKLIERVNNLSENDWSSQSRCEDWTVKEVIYHLTWCKEIIEYLGPFGFDWVWKIIRARQWEAMVTVKTLKNTNANDDVELQDFALAA